MNSKKEISIGLLGLGVVGSGVWKILNENQALLEERLGITLKVRKVLVKNIQKSRKVSVPKGLLTTKPEEILEDPNISIVVELMGGLEPAGSYIQKAILNGKHIVTANKALLTEKGGEIFSLAMEKNVSLGFEASVAGGIPIIQSIRDGFVANHIEEIYGIINGTANFILSSMSEKEISFKEALEQAQDEGYAEKDPTLDIKGIDAAQKLSLLISLCYGLSPTQKGIYTEGIDQITPLDIHFAKELGHSIKLLAISKEHKGSIRARVHPTMIPLHHPLADVGGVFNAIYLKGDAVGETMFLGKGAGMMPTASAVVSDIAMIATGAIPRTTSLLRKASFLPMESLKSEYYLRFSVVDRPGVLAKIAKILGDEEISIAHVHQEHRLVGSKVPIVVMTHEALEKNVQKAISKIDNLDVVLDKTVLIRIQRFS